ncbi:unnamed protein product, partial [Tetraodon nigroviridis]
AASACRDLADLWEKTPVQDADRRISTSHHRIKADLQTG